MQVGHLRLARQQVQVHGQLHQHALAKIAHGGHEHRAARQARVAHDLRQVLVLEAQGIGLKQRRLAFFIGLDHGSAPAGIPAHRRQRQRKVARNQSRIHQRADQRDGAGGIAAGVGHAGGGRHGLALAGGQFRKTEHPVRRCAVGGGGIDDLGFAAGQAVNHGHGFDRRLIVEAQNHQVHLRHQVTLGLRVLAQLRRNTDHLHLWHLLQPLANLQARRAGFAVDEYLGHGATHSSSVSVQMPVHIIMHYANRAQASNWCTAA